ncbi:amidohydrolase family protein [[Eubacterium] cellulosolvens]
MPDKKLFLNKNSGKKRNYYRNLNIVLAIAIIILLIAVIFRLNLLGFLFPDDKNGFENVPRAEKPFINTHDHIDNINVLGNWIYSQRLCNVSTTIMVGSPNSTFWSKPKGPFIKYLEDNELLLDMALDTNDEIIAFPTLNPNDEGNLERLKDYISRGARGLNLWTGHHGTLEGSWGETTLYDWLGPLNRTDMYPIYEYCQENRIPIIWSNNLGVREVREQFWQILEKFPGMIIKVPHFGVCFRSYNLPFIEEFLDKYEGGYTCFSWGHPDFVLEKFENISNGNRSEAIKQFFNKYQDRIMFATDIVPTDHPRKTLEWMRKHTQAYVDILSKENYHVEIKDFTPDGRDFIGDYRGLNLSDTILEKVYYKNAIKFLNGKKWNESLDDEANSTLWEFDGLHFKIPQKNLLELNAMMFYALPVKKYRVILSNLPESYIC